MIKEREVPVVRGQKLYTKREICQRQGWSGPQFERKKDRCGFVPAVPHKDTQEGRTEAWYDESQLLEMIATCDSEDEKAQLARKQLAIANTLSQEGVNMVCQGAVKARAEDLSDEGTENILANAMGFNAMMMERLAYLLKVGKEKDAQIAKQDEQIEYQAKRADQAEHEVRCISDTDAQWSSILKFNQTHKLRWDAQDCLAAGKKASQYCRNNGFKIRQVKAMEIHGRYRSVNSYPISVLNMLFLPTPKPTK